MTIDVKMPALSPTMEKGTLAKWLIQVGDMVKPGDLLAEIETDKATMEFEAADEGRLVAILVAEGTDDVPVGTVLATLGEADTAVSAEPAPRSLVEGEAPAASIAGPAPEPASAAVVTQARPAPEPALPPRGRLADKFKISPLAARIADAQRIDLTAIKGTGPNGRIVKADLGLSSPVSPPTTAPASPIVPVQPVQAPPAGVPFDTVKLSGMRKTIARRLTLAKQTVPHFYLSVDVRLDALLKLRGELNGALAAQGVKLSVNDLLVKALARALEAVPEANVQFAGDELYQFKRVDVSVAVAVDGGLVTPVIAGANTKRLSEIAREMQALAAQAREAKLLPEQYTGGTVSLSNLGMFGIERIFPVINPPQAMILGVGAGQDRIVPIERQPVVATMLTLTASFDHRAIDGAVGARALASLRGLIEEPLELLA